MSILHNFDALCCFKLCFEANIFATHVFLAGIFTYFAAHPCSRAAVRADAVAHNRSHTALHFVMQIANLAMPMQAAAFPTTCMMHWMH
jgi:hypothetical protein